MAKRYETKSERLRQENTCLVRKLQAQRKVSRRQIDELKVTLAKALEQVKGQLAKVEVLTRQIENLRPKMKSYERYWFQMSRNPEQ